MKKIKNFLCRIGIHLKKHTYRNEREVNWILMSHKITQCTNCKKIF